MDMPEGAKLLAAAARRLRASFESIREGVRHHGEQGRETQDSLIQFLNAHLPKRFRAASGYILDTQNNSVSGHVDVMIYDQQDAYVFAPAESSLIVPNDNVAAVIEVKSTLTKAELVDAAAKIQAVKGLAKLPERPTDFALQNSAIQLKYTRGILFAYSSATSLDTVWSNLKDLNQSTDSDLWIDEVVVLERGTIAYSTQFPVSRAAMHYAGKSANAVNFPFYVVPKLEETADAVLPTFMARLSTHLIYYRRRPAVAMDALLPADLRPRIVGGYWFDTQGKLREVPDSQIHSDGSPPSKPQQRVVFYDDNDDSIGQVEWMSWSDGHVLAFRVARLPIPDLVISTALMAYKPHRVQTLEVSHELLMTSLLPGLTPPNFKGVFELLSAPSVPLRARFFDWTAESAPTLAPPSS